MNKTSQIIGMVLFIAAVFGGAALYFRDTGSVNEASHVSTASWVSPSTSVDEVKAEADLVVRVRVVEVPVPRIFRDLSPVIELVNGKDTVVDTQVSEVVFSDTMFQVLTTYLGKSDSQIMVMQTGGPQPDNPKNITEMADDPLYQVGEEYVLFLVDISGDSVQAPDRTLYRIVNPSGRYQIIDEAVRTYAESTNDIQRPTTINELETQILLGSKQ